MPIYIRDIKLGLDEPEERLVEKAAQRLKVPRSMIRAYAPVRRSLDARRRGPISFAYCLELALDDSIEHEQRLVRRLHRRDVSLLEPIAISEPAPGEEPMRRRPVIIGFGPAGMFAGWRLARAGYRPLILERGQPVHTRHRDVMLRYYRRRDFDPESNLLYGEGGAGAYSDGKLYTRVNDRYVDVVLQVLYEHGAHPDILVDGKPHVGSDRLPGICRRIRQTIESMGGQIQFGSRVIDLGVSGESRVTGLQMADEFLPAEHVVLAIGHSARDTLRLLARRGVQMAAKPFQMGVRIEHPQALVDEWQYGEWTGHHRLPPADYQLVAKGAGGANRDVFTFCMCPGGMILPTNESPCRVVTNGASRAARAGRFANSGLVMTVPPEQFENNPIKGLAYQEQWEALAFEAAGSSYAVPAQRAPDYLSDHKSDGDLQTSCPLGAQWAEIRRLLPGELGAGLARALVMLDQRLPGFAGDEAIITAPETRASAPLRILRHAQTRESLSVQGLFPVGEGAGYAGGIISAAIDGIKTANELISRWAPPR